MIVLDASVIANVVGDDGSNGEVARRALIAEPEAAVPDLADVETAAVLRKRWLAGDLNDRRFSAALDDLVRLPFLRYPSLPFMRRAYQLRANVTAYDAAYVALAEVLRCELVTADVRLSRTPGIRCPIRVLTAAGS